MNQKILYCLLYALILISIPQLGIAQSSYPDSLYHINGDVLTGELKQLNYGVFLYKMDGMGTINIESVKINSIQSARLFEIKMKSDTIYFGSFEANSEPKKVTIVTKTDRLLVDLANIVEIYPIKKSFWMRTSGSFGLGGNYSKGSNVATLAFSGNISYRKKKTFFVISVDDNNTYQEDSLTSIKADINVAWQRLLKHGWSTEASFSVGRNSELGTKRRLAYNVLGLKDLAYNKWNRLYVGSGLSVMQETSYEDPTTDTDLSAIFQVVWKVYKFSSPKVLVASDISVLPYFTDPGRTRAVLNLNPSISILGNNLTIGVKFYYSLDTEPPSGATSDNDYGSNIQLAYSFH